MLIDSHTHAFPDPIAASTIKTLSAHSKWVPVHAYADGTVAGLLASMDRAGVTQSILCSIATKSSQVTKITDWSVAVASDRIIPFASIHPDYPTPEAECQRIAALGLRGIKFHPQYQNCAVDDPRTHRIARAAAAAGLAMTFHAGHDLAFDKTDLAAPAALRRLFDAVPTLNLQCCHLGGWERWDEALALLVGLPIYLETSFCLTTCPRPLLDQIVARHPPTHLMWGTDSPWADQAAELTLFNNLPLSPPARELALWKNALTFTRTAAKHI